MGYIRRHNFIPFALYRIAVGLVLWLARAERNSSAPLSSWTHLDGSPDIQRRVPPWSDASFLRGAGAEWFCTSFELCSFC